MTRKENLQLFAYMMGLHAQHFEHLVLAKKELNRRCDMIDKITATLIRLSSDKWSDNHDELQKLCATLEDPAVRDENRRADSHFQHHFEQCTAMLADFKAKIEAMPDE
jgi:hypothetical protein